MQSEEMGLTDIQLRALRFIGNRNAEGLAARMPYAELIVAADDLAHKGLAQWADHGRWLTAAGRTALSAIEDAP
jgi:hypothetical protein